MYHVLLCCCNDIKSVNLLQDAAPQSLYSVKSHVSSFSAKSGSKGKKDQTLTPDPWRFINMLRKLF